MDKTHDMDELLMLYPQCLDYVRRIFMVAAHAHPAASLPRLLGAAGVHRLSPHCLKVYSIREEDKMVPTIRVKLDKPSVIRTG